MAWQKIGTKSTDADGNVVFDNLPFGNYRYIQASTKTGYTVDSTPHDVTISSTTPVSQDRTNTPAAAGTLKVVKFSEGYPDWKLANGKFKLTDSSGKALLTLSGGTDADGELLLENLMTISENPQSYKITEQEAPTGYDVNTTEYTAEITVNATTEQQVPNTPTTSGEIGISLTDTNYTEYTLPNAEYEIWADL